MDQWGDIRELSRPTVTLTGWDGFVYGVWVVIFLILAFLRWRERKERTKALKQTHPPYKRDNNGIIREAIRDGTKIYALVRLLDRWVHADEFWRINVYDEASVKNWTIFDKTSWELVEVDPLDPTANFNVDSYGSFWDGPIPYGRE